MNKDSVKQISISFENKEIEQSIAQFIKEKKKTIGVSEYIKRLVMKDMIKTEQSIN